MEFQFHSVGADFMAALEMDVVLGREFTDADDADAAMVVMANETFAERFWPGENPLQARELERAGRRAGGRSRRRRDVS